VAELSQWGGLFSVKGNARPREKRHKGCVERCLYVTSYLLWLVVFYCLGRERGYTRSREELSTSGETRRRGADDPTFPQPLRRIDLFAQRMFSLRSVSGCLRSSMSSPVAYHRYRVRAHRSWDDPDQEPPILGRRGRPGSFFARESARRA